jgi:hypothetical protein
MHQVGENRKTKRVHFSSEEDHFLELILRDIKVEKDLLDWKLIHQLFNKQFPLKQKTKYQITYHVKNCLNSKDKKHLFQDKKKKDFVFS